MGRTFRKDKDWDRPRYKRKALKPNTNNYSEEDIDYAEDLHTEEACVRRKQASENSKKHPRRSKKR